MLVKDYQRRFWLVHLFLLQISWDVVVCQLHYIIPEESKHGTFVGRIAQDLGLQMNEMNSRMLRIVSRDEKQYFQVNLQNGILFVKEIIDREEICPAMPVCVISLQVIVDKPVQMHRVDVEIEDINDNYPFFFANEYIFTILESRLPGYRFPLEGAVDADIGTNSVTNYDVSTNDYFIIEFTKYVHQIRTLDLVLKKPLDREKLSFHNLTLIAFDGGKPKLSGTTKLLIMVEDTNDNAPTFDQPFYQCSVVENAPIGTFVYKLNATDQDQGRNGEILYDFSKLVPEQVKKIFSLDKHTGEITVIGEVDFETRNVYEIQIDAADNGEPSLVGHCKLLVSIIDANDNPPELTVTSISVPVPEDAPQGTTVAIISAHDRDSGTNGRINCYISEPRTFKIIPAFAGDFSITVDAPLDRETKSEYEVVITAKDEGSPVLSVSKTIKVEISDVNDNPPEFLQSVNTIFLKENNPPGSHIYSASAIDLDVNQNSFITYSLTENAINGVPLSSIISINPENGNLFALLSFDFEQLAHFQCEVKATDAGLPPLSSYLTLNIFIVDVNDNSPYFSLSGSTEIIKSLKSAQAGSLVTKITATDLDSGYNAWISYEFKKTLVSLPFQISQKTGEIRLTRSFMESDAEEFRLTVVAKDHGEPSMSTVMPIIISLVDSEEDLKLDYQNLYEKEDEFTSANVYLVIAICTISSIFLITLIAFTVIRWQKYRDEVNELRESYKACSNTVGSWIYSQQSQYKLYLNSLQRNDLIVFTPNCPQSSDKERNSNTGALLNPLRLLQHIHLCKMLVKDYQRKCWLVHFFLLKISWDVVLCQLHYIIPEESKHGTFVGRIAQDLGLQMSEINSRMLRIVFRDEKQYFQVNLQNGILFVKDIIDREEICADIPVCVISLQVIVDKPVQMYQVDVEIEDINDNYPVFFANEYFVSILESRLPGSRFPLEGAADADIGTNSVTNYELSTNDYFILEFTKYIHQIRTLELVLKKPLDREKISFHNLTLMAFDGGKPKLSGTTQLVITVEDTNDNVPTFDQPFYQCSVMENAPMGTFVYKLNATDLDEGKNGEISYDFSKLVPEHVRKIFRLDKQTGEITVIGEVDFETRSMYEIHIDAVDNGERSLVGHCKVLVSITDVNDNPPELTVTSLSVPVPEDAPQGTTVAIITAHDRDSGANGRINCYISDLRTFKIIPAFAGVFSLTVVAPLDRETNSEYELVITAKDEGSPSLSASKSIKVDVSDVNDNAPEFLQSVDTIFLKENNPPGSHIYTVLATDPDINQNSFITYSLSESSVNGVPLSSFLSINPENGNLFALLSFDHEQLNYFQCEVKATDAGLPPLSSYLTLHIFIVDVNDNAPYFSPLPSISESKEIIKSLKSAQAGSLVTKITAVDLDSGYNAWISYEFKKSLTSLPFKISQKTGEIRLTRSIMESDGEAFRLVVVAQDHGEPSMSTAMPIIISLVDSEEELKIENQYANEKEDNFTNANVYLVIAICSISSIFLITLIGFTILRWQKYRDEVNELRESYKVCSNTVGSWIYSQESQYKLYLNSLQRNDLIVFTPNCSQSSENKRNSNEPEMEVNSSLQIFHESLETKNYATLYLDVLIHNEKKQLTGETNLYEYKMKMLVKYYQGRCWLVHFFLLQISWDLFVCQLHYIIPEESKHGTFVGRIAQDLGLQMSEINSRMLRIVSRDEKQYFQVNLQNGILFVRDIIDREEICLDMPVCIISLQVIVDKPVQMYRVDVEIEDINDNYPVFFANEYFVSILESRLPGSRFPLEGAVDADIGTNSVTNYELSTNDYFILEFTKYIHQIRTLELVLKKPLDREKKAFHNLTLMAFDGGKPKLSGTTQLLISVEDTNDNVPTFDQPFYQCSVVENAPIGTFVYKLKAIDLDEGKNGEISYDFSKLVPEQVRKIFSLDKHTGEITVKGEVDFELKTMYEIHIDAVDNGDRSQVGHCKVLVSITDVNDNPPELTITSLSVPIPEDAPQGTTVAIISVYDRDSGANGRINCYISEPKTFKIIPAFAGDFSLTVDAPLDREAKSEYELIITAKDEGSPSLYTFKTIKVNISDVNDNAPQFLQSDHTIFLKENNPPGSHIYTVSALDLDINQNSFITYSVSESTINGIPLSSFISINPENGKLFALLSFDHEQLNYFQCEVKATDAGLPPLSSYLTVHIFIEDVNDNAPYFSPLSSLSGSTEIIKSLKSGKAGSLVSKITAVDLDSGYNAWISYEFKKTLVNLPFQISQKTGEIRLIRSITESDGDEFRLVMVAQDHGEPSMSTTMPIIISLVDSEENLKVENHYSDEKEDDYTNANVFLVIAICSISSIFLITLIVFTILRWQKYRDEVNELKESYKVCSNTVGSWIYSQQSQYKLYLNSLQRNDLIVFTPNCSQSSENERNSNEPGIEANSSFQLNSEEVNWEMLVKDCQGRCWLVHFFLLHISWDLVVSQLHYIIPEESKHGTFVGRLAQDLGLQMSEINSRMLRIVSRDEKQYFQVNLQNGILFVTDIIDREDICPDIPICVISLQVIVDKPVQMYQVDVEIEDINDNYPLFFANKYIVSVSESRLPGYRLPLEGAVDADIGTNSVTNYELSTNEYFILEFTKYIHQIRTLELVIKKSLDREKKSFHNLTLMAFDGGKPKLSGTTQLLINVEDTNDNAPTFDQPFYQCSVLENAPIGTFVYKLNAIDLDEGKHGEISYDFSKLVPEQVKAIFSLDKHTGEITVKGEVDFETRNMYEIQIDAVDNGEHSLVGHCKVLVSITDVNDNPPELTITSLSVPVPEDAPQGTTVAIISVHDRDSGANGRINCYVSDPKTFKIIPAFTGIFSLTVDAPLDRETISEYEVIITAKDEGSPALSVSKTIKVDISDVNDNAPAFLQTVNKIFIKENNPPGSHIYSVSASDPDINQNSFITYSISESAVNGVPLSSFISINPENGNLFALLSFDHEQLNYFQCEVKATDAGLPPLSSYLTLHIFILDVNDNAPYFSPFSSLRESTEIIKSLKSAQIGSLVTKVTAIDLDSGYNAWISYEFKKSLTSLPFKISQKTGEIRLTRSIIESDGEEFRLVVVAQDHGEPAMSTVMPIIISLVDSEDDLKVDNQYANEKEDDFTNANVYLVIGICSISSIFLITLIAFTVLRWQIYRDEVNELRENYKVCSNTVGSWIYSQQSQYKLYLNSLQRNDLIVFTPNSSQPLENEGNSTGPGNVANSSCQEHHCTTGSSFILLEFSIESAEMRPFSSPRGDRKDRLGYKNILDLLSTKLLEVEHEVILALTGSAISPELATQRGEMQQQELAENSPGKSEGVKANGLPAARVAELASIRPVDYSECFTPLDDSAPQMENGEERPCSRHPNGNQLSQIPFRYKLPHLLGATLDPRWVIMVRETVTYDMPVGKVGRCDPAAECSAVEHGPFDTFWPVDAATESCRVSVLDADLFSHSMAHVRFFYLPRQAWMTVSCKFLYGRTLQVMGPSLHNVIKYGKSGIGNSILRFWDTRIILILCYYNTVVGQIGYSVVEELEEGTVIGNLAHDLRVDVSHLFNRKFQMTYDTKIQYFDIDAKQGSLYIANIIDREELCGSNVICEIKLGLIIDKPLELYQIEIQIVDINDNSPFFPEMESVLKIAESTALGTKFPLEGAFDPDVTSNTVCLYIISTNDFFGIEMNSRDYGSKSLELVLNNALDREQHTSHELILNALDCGSPKRSGTAHILILVQDANDNHPTFEQPVYSVSIPENLPLGSLIVVLNATDLDEGANGEIQFTFSNIVPITTRKLFEIDNDNGEIRLVGFLNYEERTSYEIHVQAKDNGQLSMTGYCKVIVTVTDVNDNVPEIKMTSLFNSLQEDSEPGLVIAFFTVTDRDSGLNGEVTCQILDKLPFILESKFSNFYSLVLKEALDREVVSQYKVIILASDAGIPSLSVTINVNIIVSDVNDNPPIFTNSSYTLSLPENMVPGTLIFQISALDKDSGKNSHILYSIVETFWREMSITHFFSIHPDSGKIFSFNPLDYEKIQVLNILVKASDYGSPSLSNTANITIFIKDQNDNSPQISSSLPSRDFIDRSAEIGYMVTKVTAIDSDSGYNAWLSYELVESTNATLFKIGLYTGEIYVARNIEETDEEIHKLVILVKDHGNPPKSTTATVSITILETNRKIRDDDRKLFIQKESKMIDFNFYLILLLSFISSIILFIALFYIGVKYYKAFGSNDSWKTTEDLEYVKNDWTMSASQKCNLHFTPPYANTYPKDETASTACFKDCDTIGITDEWMIFNNGLGDQRLGSQKVIVEAKNELINIKHTKVLRDKSDYDIGKKYIWNKGQRFQYRRSQNKNRGYRRGRGARQRGRGN
ncbi:uncharacterized protein LOC128664795 [Bombina bombina]|uniref:uncharacterized protein LOC128664795 n=1 Tax=Bombina bombina TaxID=8345 RepID=UPI00235A4BB8|nr:uncharacterized protein LOC128664795 [Bombina bombina]